MLRLSWTCRPSRHYDYHACALRYSKNGTIAFLPSGNRSPNVCLYHAKPLIARGVMFAAAFNAKRYGGAISTDGHAASGIHERS